MSSNKVVVVIPVHKPALTQNELASLKQCYKILGSHPIRIVAPEGMDMSVYQNAVPECETIFIAPEWLSNIQQYNKLKISKYFYDLFKEYEFLLTYELDAWVFRDELLYWCDKGYDYIGAPWFEGWTQPSSNIFIKGGNSGFSLRNVQEIRKMIPKIRRFLRYKRVWDRLKLNNICPLETMRFMESILSIKTNEEFKMIHALGYLNEDMFWSRYTPSIISNFNVADAEVSLKFSFELKPEFLFELNNNHLPFGCHSWEKYGLNFWTNYIQII